MVCVHRQMCYGVMSLCTYGCRYVDVCTGVYVEHVLSSKEWKRHKYDTHMHIHT